MDENNSGVIKSKAISSAIWKFSERFCAQTVSLVVSIIIARILSPSDYGVVSIVTIFFTFANILISGGLNTALIQKKGADEEDYSTVFWVSILVSLILYVLLFFLAPFIAVLYDKEILIPVIRVMSLVLPINAAKSVVCAYVSSKLQFKKFFFATIVGTIISAIVGIAMAYNGFGPWALVFQHLTNYCIDTIILYLTVKIKIRFVISMKKLSGLFSYGWKVLASSLLNETYNNVIPLFIGIKFNSESLSYYTKGRSFPTLLSTAATNTLSAVLFPVLSYYQDRKDLLLKYTRRYIQLASYIAFPVMLGFFAISDNFIRVLLTEKWMPASLYIKIFCFSLVFEVVATGNCETIKAIGRSDIFLLIEIIKKVSYFIVIGMFMIFADTPEILALSSIVCTAISIIVNIWPNRKLIGYKVTTQLMDMAPNMVSTVIMVIPVTLIGKISLPPLATLFIQIVAGIMIYIFSNWILRNSNQKYFFSALLGVIKKIK